MQCWVHRRTRSSGQGSTWLVQVWCSQLILSVRKWTKGNLSNTISLQTAKTHILVIMKSMANCINNNMNEKQQRSVPFCLYLNNKMDILHITRRKLTIQNLQNRTVTEIVRQVATAQYKWTKYCLISFEFILNSPTFGTWPQVAQDAAEIKCGTDVLEMRWSQRITNK